MVIECPSCRARYRIDPSGIDKKVARVRCPKCGHGFEIDLAGPARPKILIVDDARFFREVVLDILSQLAVTILKAGDGDEALDLIRGERPDLVILDLKLPGKDGYQLVREVRADPALASTKLLAMSSVYRGEDEIRRIMQIGADDFLNKSFRPEQLLLRVRKLLDAASGHV
ncbi:two-component system chemotaxis response regulator CheY [Geothermobacter ehrlichii]|uniref:Two-component system chemotaxis response regulator CheY n=1 Tax=Geothermobacter ehrlichii TaxID=213224 RepID=A0A5D3WKD4_9BACT|nr:response regulator [Geothermobacter ehrlichii]TYO98818.1 two-component system chemotaxis response regulator CheY [Geothermobacter ehrlichii]